MKVLDIRQSIVFGFKNLRKFLFLFLFIPLLFLSKYCFGISHFLDNIFFGLFLIIFYIALFCVYKIALNEKNVLYLFSKFVMAITIYFAFVFLGLMFFIIPGIIVMVKFQFVPFIILKEKDIGIREAFSKSNSLAKFRHIKLFQLLVVLGLINLIGFMIFAITIPATISAKAFIYEEISA